VQLCAAVTESLSHNRIARMKTSERECLKLLSKNSISAVMDCEDFHGSGVSYKVAVVGRQ